MNVLLFCAWIGASCRAVLSAEQLGCAEDIVRGWHEDVVQPLRHARNTIKQTSDLADEEITALRKQVLASELAAERIEQALLYQAGLHHAAASTSHTADAAIRTNVQLLLQRKARAAGRPAPSLPAALIAAAEKLGVNS